MGHLNENSKKVNSENLINKWFVYPDEIMKLKDHELLPKLKDILSEVADKHFLIEYPPKL